MVKQKTNYKDNDSMPIRIKIKTIKALKTLGYMGESYDMVIWRLIKKENKKIKVPTEYEGRL